MTSIGNSDEEKIVQEKSAPESVRAANSFAGKGYRNACALIRAAGVNLEEIVAGPPASAMVESLRDLGYSLDSAIADIIDNSMSAQATEIRVSLHDWETSSPMVRIVDDGHGMSAEELLEAMRPGCRSPLEHRDAKDLGRFGLGLKTASFSQCRQLTVISWKEGNYHGCRWDLDRIRETNEWTLQILASEEMKDLVQGLNVEESGTVVIWKKLDRLLDKTSSSSQGEDILERFDRAGRHVGKVFHRFIQGTAGCAKCAIHWGNRKLDAFDPFHTAHSSTQAAPEQTVNVLGEKVVFQAYTLPHHSKVKSREWEHYGTEKGYLKAQGFYVYRAGRLIIDSTWFSLIKASELTRLARVRVDIPNALDHIWKVDVKKASAHPPFLIRKHLKAVIEQVVVPARRVYRQRGHRKSVSEDSLWERVAKNNLVTYQLNKSHPRIAELLERLEVEERMLVYQLLAGVEQQFPVDSVFHDYAHQPKAFQKVEEPMGDESVLRAAVEHLAGTGATVEEIQEKLADLPLKKLPYKKLKKLLEKRNE